MKRGHRADAVRDLRINAAVKVLDFLAATQEALKATDLTHAEIASKIGVRRAQLVGWLHAETDLRAKDLFLLCDALGCDIRFDWPKR